MHAIGLTDFGGPEKLLPMELPEPHAERGQVRLRVQAATVNPTDALTRAGRRSHLMRHLEPPYILGMEAIGVVDEVGEDASWTVGQLVMAMTLPLSGAGGAYGEYVVVPSAHAVSVPLGLDGIAAAALPMNGLTALLALEALGPASTVAVTGAGGVVGGYVVQLAAHTGRRVIADASNQDRARIGRLGADIVVERGMDVARRILKHIPDGVDALVDASAQHGDVVPAIKAGGRLVSLREWTGELTGDIRRRFVRASCGLQRDGLLTAVRDYAERRVITPRIATTLPLEQAAEAHRLLELGGIAGRIVLLP